jgi:hypothetical protein
MGWTNNGLLEYWSGGVMVRENLTNTPILHHSNLLYSITPVVAGRVVKGS